MQGERPASNTPQIEALIAFGLHPDEVDMVRTGRTEEAVCWVFPPNWPAYLVFDSLQTQWRIGMNGPTGIDYAALPVVLDSLQIKRGKRPAIFQSIRIMENETLAVWAERRAR